MTIYDVFRDAIERGIEKDFRPRLEVLSYEWRETVAGPGGVSFVNPYPDSGVVWCEDLGASVSRVAIGIDVEEGELAALREWDREEDKHIDLVIGHHPQGRPMAAFPHILKTQIGNLAGNRVPASTLEPFFAKLVAEDEQGVLGDNVNRVGDIAALLKLNYVSLHSPIDNLSARLVEDLVQREKPKTLGACRDLLATVPEYAAVKALDRVAPTIAIGTPEDPLGAFLLTEFVGGEEGPEEVYEVMKQAGIATIIAMHMTPEGLERLTNWGINVIAAGHVASDSIGLNLMSDYLSGKGLEIIPIGGFIRCERKKAMLEYSRSNYED